MSRSSYRFISIFADGLKEKVKAVFGFQFDLHCTRRFPPRRLDPLSRAHRMNFKSGGSGFPPSVQPACEAAGQTSENTMSRFYE